MLGKVALGLEGKCTVPARVWPQIGMCANVLLQHRGLLTPDAALFADVLSTATTAYIRVVFV